jgi:hypothetical protein
MSCMHIFSFLPCLPQSVYHPFPFHHSSRQVYQMSAALSATCGALKKSKLEKIFELEADLKFVTEENCRLKRELDQVPFEDFCSRHSVSSSDTGQIKSMKDAISALREVTISQERSLHSMRFTEETERRQTTTSCYGFAGQTTQNS